MRLDDFVAHLNDVRTESKSHDQAGEARRRRQTEDDSVIISGRLVNISDDSVMILLGDSIAHIPKAAVLDIELDPSQPAIEGYVRDACNFVSQRGSSGKVSFLG